MTRREIFGVMGVMIGAGNDGLARVMISFAWILEMLVVLMVAIIAGSDGLVKVVICFARMFQMLGDLEVTIIAGSDGLVRVVICFAGVGTSDDGLIDISVRWTMSRAESERVKRINVVGSVRIRASDGLEIVMVGWMAKTRIERITSDRWTTMRADGNPRLVSFGVVCWPIKEFVFKDTMTTKDCRFHRRRQEIMAVINTGRGMFGRSNGMDRIEMTG